MSKQDVVDYVMETPENTNKAVLEGLVDTAIGESQVQVDWNQNDETAKDYIKNRIGYYNYELHSNFFDEGDLAQETGVDFDETPIMPEQDYKIIYGNQEYELTCRSSSQFSNNFYIIGKNFGSETGFDYPFQFYVPSYTSSKTLYVTIYGDIPEPKVLKIEGISWKKNIQIKKIPDECVNFYQSDWNENDPHEKSYIKNTPTIYMPNFKATSGVIVEDSNPITKLCYFPNGHVYKVEIFSKKTAKVGVFQKTGSTETTLIADSIIVNKDTIGYLGENTSMRNGDRRYYSYTFPFSTFGVHNKIDAWRFQQPNELQKPYIKLTLQETLGESDSWEPGVIFYYFE